MTTNSRFIPDDILRAILENFNDPAENVTKTNKTRSTQWKVAMRTKRMVVRVCRQWWFVGTPLLYKDVCLHTVGRLSQIARTLKSRVDRPVELQDRSFQLNYGELVLMVAFNFRSKSHPQLQEQCTNDLAKLLLCCPNIRTLICKPTSWWIFAQRMSMTPVLRSSTPTSVSHLVLPRSDGFRNVEPRDNFFRDVHELGPLASSLETLEFWPFVVSKEVDATGGSVRPAYLPHLHTLQCNFIDEALFTWYMELIAEWSVPKLRNFSLNFLSVVPHLSVIQNALSLFSKKHRENMQSISLRLVKATPDYTIFLDTLPKTFTNLTSITLRTPKAQFANRVNFCTNFRHSTSHPSVRHIAVNFLSPHESLFSYRGGKAFPSLISVCLLHVRWRRGLSDVARNDRGELMIWLDLASKWGFRLEASDGFAITFQSSSL